MSIIGPISFVHPLEIAIATAVVGPPILALDANTMSSKLNFKSLPNTKQKIIFVKSNY